MQNVGFVHFARTSQTAMARPKVTESIDGLTKLSG